jgi:hypothetical protein
MPGKINNINMFRVNKKTGRRSFDLRPVTVRIGEALCFGTCLIYRKKAVLI